MTRPDPDLSRIRLILTDVDGVLTDGRIHFDGDGRESKTFHVHDAAGIVYWHRWHGMSGLISGRGGRAVEIRAEELGMHEVHLERHDKLNVLEDVLARRGLQPDQVCYVGDDLLDLPVLARVGFAVSVPNGRVEVRRAVHWVTGVAGGDGALREVVEHVMKAQGTWDDVVAKGGLP